MLYEVITGDGCRPAMAKVREALFNMLAARGLDMDGARVIDVFAGTGSLGFESLSRGAAHVVITSYSIHYTKLYDFAFCRRVPLPYQNYSIFWHQAFPVQ